MKTLQKLAIAAAATLFFSGCATISNSPNQSVSISTNTGDVVVADINGEKVTLPAAVKISRKGETIVKVLPADNPGFEATQIVITGKQKLSGWFWANIITGGTTGSTTDAASGGAWEYANPNFVVPVKKKPKRR